jgi:hypothetical protein
MPGNDDADSCVPSNIAIFFEKSAGDFLPSNACESLEEVFLSVLKWLL